MGSGSSRSQSKVKEDTSLRKRICAIIDEEEELKKGSDLNFIGLQHVLPKSIRLGMRLAWAIVIITCLVLCVIQIVDRVEYYYTYPKDVTIILDERPTVKFPEIVLVQERSPNFRPSKDAKKNIGAKTECDVKLIDLVDKCCQLELVPPYLRDAEVVWVKWGRFVNTIATVNEDKRFGVPFVKVNKTVVTEQFTHTYYGAAVKLEQIHDDATRDTVYYGTMSSLGLVLVGLEPDYDCETMPLMLIKEEGGHFDPTTAKYFGPEIFNGVAFKLQELHRLSTPNDPCIPRDENVKCIEECYKRKLDELPCSLPYMPDANKTKPFCTDRLEARAVHEKAYVISQYKTLHEKCGCIKSCQENTLTQQFETIDRPSNAFIQFYFPTSIVEMSNETLAYDLSQLISDVGGNLGLFLGFCLLSLVDSLQLFIDLIYEKMEDRKENRKTNPNSTTAPVIPMYATQSNVGIPSSYHTMGNQGLTAP